MQGGDVEDPDTHDITEGQWRREVTLTPVDRAPRSCSLRAAKNIRAYLMDYYNSPVGAVHW